MKLKRNIAALAMAGAAAGALTVGAAGTAQAAPSGDPLSTGCANGAQTIDQAARSLRLGRTRARRPSEGQSEGVRRVLRYRAPGELTSWHSRRIPPARSIHSLKDELQSALRVRWRGNPIHSLRKQITQCSVTGFLCHFVQDKKYATDKYKDIYTELSIVKAKADCDISKLKEKLLMATEALGEQNVDGSISCFRYWISDSLIRSKTCETDTD